MDINLYKLQELKEIAKANGIHISGKKKQELFKLLKAKGLFKTKSKHNTLKMRMGPDEEQLTFDLMETGLEYPEARREALKIKSGKTNYSRIFEACKNGNIEQIKDFFKEFPGDIPDTVFKDAFIHTVDGGDYLNVVKYLVRHNGENIHSWSGFLYWAALNGRLKIVKYLLDAGIDVNIHIDGRLDGAAINAASRNRHLNVVRYLVLHGADPRGNAKTIIRGAAVSGDLKLLKFFVDKCGLDPHIDNDAAVRLASEHNHFNIVKYLVLHGAPTTNISPEFRDRLTETLNIIAKRVKTQWRRRMEADEADVTSRFGKYMMEKNYNDYLKMTNV
jgi:hypothetical protein